MNPKDSIGAKKAPLSVVPAALVLAAAPAMAVGANKYGPFNWRGQKVQAMTYVEAVLRHLYAWVDGQDLAEDTGVSHIGHAIAGLGILADAIAQDNIIDNRPPAGPAADMLRAQDRSLSVVPTGPVNMAEVRHERLLNGDAPACTCLWTIGKLHGFMCPQFHIVDATA